MSTLLEIQMAKFLNLDDAQLAAEMQAKPARQVMAEFLYALTQLIVHHKVMHDVTDLSVNFHGGARRVDIATLTEDGQHLAQWLLGLNANVLDEQCGAPVGLPGTTGPTH